MIDKIKDNSVIYYPYYVKEGDTPEIVAYKYYKDIQKHWLVLMANSIIDPMFGWPLDYNSFLLYIAQKYGGDEVIQIQTEPYDIGTNFRLGHSFLGSGLETIQPDLSGVDTARQIIHHYEMTISRTDSSTGLTTSQAIIIDNDTYNNLPNFTFNEYNLSDNTTVTEIIQTGIVYAFDWELQQNENKKNIQLISKDYLAQIEDEFMTILAKA